MLTRQSLDRRMASRNAVENGSAWTDDRDDRQVGVVWQFTTADARIKLKHLYPRILV